MVIVSKKISDNGLEDLVKEVDINDLRKWREKPKVEGVATGKEEEEDLVMAGLGSDAPVDKKKLKRQSQKQKHQQAMK